MPSIKKVLPTLAVILIIHSCIKDEHFEANENPEVELTNVAEIGCYLPIYPGSCWVYSNGDTVRAGSQYHLDTVFSASYWFPDFPEECVAVDTTHMLTLNYPHFQLRNSVRKYLNKYTLYGLDDRCEVDFKVLSEEIGEKWYISWDNLQDSRFEVIERLASVTMPDGQSYSDVMVIEEQYIGNLWLCSQTRRYYAKSIGLIGEQQFVAPFKEGYLETPIWTFFLSSYKSGPS